jgi:hypothetical protein
MKVPGTFTASIVTVAELNGLGHVVTSGTRPSGAEVYEGRRIYETDTSMWQSYDGSAWSPIGPVDGALTDWTPTVDQGASTNIGKSSTYAKVSRVGRQIQATFRVVFNASGTAGSAIVVSLPVAAAATSNITAIGSGVFITSGAFYIPLTAIIGVTSNRMQFVSSALETNTYFGVSSETIATGEILTATIAYESAL